MGYLPPSPIPQNSRFLLHPVTAGYGRVLTILSNPAFVEAVI